MSSFREHIEETTGLTATRSAMLGLALIAWGAGLGRRFAEAVRG